MTIPGKPSIGKLCERAGWLGHQKHPYTNSRATMAGCEDDEMMQIAVIIESDRRTAVHVNGPRYTGTLPCTTKWTSLN